MSNFFSKQIKTFIEENEKFFLHHYLLIEIKRVVFPSSLLILIFKNPQRLFFARKFENEKERKLNSRKGLKSKRGKRYFNLYLLEQDPNRFQFSREIGIRGGRKNGEWEREKGQEEKKESLCWTLTRVMLYGHEGIIVFAIGGIFHYTRSPYLCRCISNLKDTIRRIMENK